MEYHSPIGHRKRSRSSKGDSIGIEETTSASGTSKGARSQFLPEALQAVVRVEPFKKKAKVAKKNRWMSVSSLIVKLRFSGRLVIEDAKTRSTTPSLREPTQPPSTPVNLNTLHDFTAPATAQTIRTLNTPHTTCSISSVHDYVPFERSWADETQDFNMRMVRSTIRHPDTSVKDLGKNFTWYNDAVAADALLPPGIPLSAKEILAYYPHHVRWTGVMLRLSNNDYRGANIMGIQAKLSYHRAEFFRGPPDQNTTPAAMNQYQRDALKTIIPGFKTDTLNGKHDRKIHTTHLTPGRYIQEKRSGYTVPTFDDLLRGLRHLPSGLDARSLTESLNWYLHMRTTFTRPLQLNVLHTQSLIRALRIPLKPFGPQNLDCNALQEYKDNGRFAARSICSDAVTKENNTPADSEVGSGGRDTQRSQLHLNLASHTVDLAVQLPLRHILTFPFLALHGVVAHALNHGIARAETKLMERGNREAKERLEAKWAARVAGDDGEDAGFDAQGGLRSDERGVAGFKPLELQTGDGEIREVEKWSRRKYQGSPQALTTSALRSLAPAPRKFVHDSSSPVNGGLLAASRVPTGPRALTSSPSSARNVVPYSRGDEGVSAFSPVYGQREYEGQLSGGSGCV